MLHQTHQVWRRRRQQKLSSNLEIKLSAPEFLKHRVWCRRRQPKTKTVWHHRHLQKHIANSAQHCTKHIKFGAGGTSKTPNKSRNQSLNARVSFLSIEFGAGGASEKRNRVWHQQSLQKHMDYSAQRWTRHIKFGAGGASK